MYAHFSYVQAFNGLQDYLKKLSRNAIQSYEFNYANRSILRHNINNSNYVKELPAAIITVTPNHQSNNQTLHNIGNSSIYSDEHLLLARNNTNGEDSFAYMKKTTFSIQIQINVNSSTQTVSFADMFYDNLPMNRYFYPYSYTDFVEISRQTLHWDWTKDDIENTVTKVEKTTGKTFHMAKVVTEPLIRLNSLNTDIDNDSMRYGIQVSLDMEFWIPATTIIKRYHIVKDIVPVIDITNEKLSDNPMYTEINNINALIDDSVKRSILINKTQIDLENKTFAIETEKVKSLNLLEQDVDKFRKTLLFIDTNNNVTDKESLIIKLSPGQIKDDKIIFSLKTSQDIKEIKISDQSLIVLSTFD